MKKNFFIIGLLFSIFLFSQNISAQTRSTILTKKEIKKWYKNGAWLNGLELTPHKSINQEELSKQYQTSTVWWDKAFEFLRNNDLDNIEPGSYIIDEGNVIAYVSEAPTKEMDAIKWETHNNFNDLQYIIVGQAKMGIVSVNGSGASVTVPYDSKRDVTNYEVNDAKYYVAKSGTFFIFTPKDIHRPAFKMPGYDRVKKILIKVRVP
ncbi:YhcH/YjgK/YiaL family protein [Flavobacteriaceae bacterium LMO-SS05]